MQNQEFSEEYYKMKYFKYRAKYEQLKEIAQVRSGLQSGGSNLNDNPTSYVSGQGVVQETNQGTNQVRIEDKTQQPKSSYLSSISSTLSSASKMIGFDKESREKNMKLKQERQIATSDNINTLLNDIYLFSSEHMDSNKKERLRVRLESPCTTAKLIEYINNAPKAPKDKTYTFDDAMALFKTYEATKSDLIARVNKLCKTNLGSLNEACRMPNLDEEEKQKAPATAQSGGYTLTPDSLDDINTEF